MSLPDDYDTWTDNQNNACLELLSTCHHISEVGIEDAGPLFGTLINAFIHHSVRTFRPHLVYPQYTNIVPQAGTPQDILSLLLKKTTVTATTLRHWEQEIEWNGWDHYNITSKSSQTAVELRFVDDVHMSLNAFPRSLHDPYWVPLADTDIPTPKRVCGTWDENSQRWVGHWRL